MAVKRDYYEVLGVSRDADDKEIKGAFRKLAFQCHPDHNHDEGAEERFKELNEAYAVLSDTDKRAAYDHYGHSGGEEFFGRGSDGFDFGGIGDIFDAFFGGVGGSARRRPQHGADLQSSITISFEEAALGCKKEVTVMSTEVCSVCNGSGCKSGSKPIRCSHCDGTGQVRRVQRSVFGRFINATVCDQCRGVGTIITEPCPQCRGSGSQKCKRSISLEIPPGVDDGVTMRLNGEGDLGGRGGSPGNLYVTLSVEEHEFFIRDGYDVIFQLPINFAQAALGTEVEVPTLYGNSKINIPPGSQTGKGFRLKGKGIPHLHKNGHGDQMVRLFVTTPDSLTKQQRQLFEELAKTLDPAKRVNTDT